jgi:hypothetical protein
MRRNPVRVTGRRLSWKLEYVTIVDSPSLKADCTSHWVQTMETPPPMMRQQDDIGRRIPPMPSTEISASDIYPLGSRINLQSAEKKKTFCVAENLVLELTRRLSPAYGAVNLRYRCRIIDGPADVDPDVVALIYDPQVVPLYALGLKNTSMTSLFPL